MLTAYRFLLSLLFGPTRMDSQHCLDTYIFSASIHLSKCNYFDLICEESWEVRGKMNDDGDALVTARNMYLLLCTSTY